MTVQLAGLVKSFGGRRAVDGLDLDVSAGCLFGLVGPNGAGKTTTMSMATGLLRPDAGTVRVLGRDVWADPAAAKSAMGVLPDGVRLFDRLSGRELVACHGALRGVPHAQVAARTAELLDVLGLSVDADVQVVDYSAGMKKKVGLACALIHAPRLLVLDEPFEGVDPVSRGMVESILRHYVRGGGTVVLSSHVMEHVERLCDELAVVVSGRVQAVGTLDEVRAGKTLQQRFLELVEFRTLGEDELAVALLIRLKLTLLRNRLRRSLADTINLVVWSVVAFALVAVALAGLVVLRWAADAATADATAVAFAGLTVGWLVLPLVVFGVDETLDPARFALLPVRARELVPGLLAAGLVGIPGVATVLLGVGFVATWARTPAFTAAALLAAALGTLTCVLLSRAASAAFSAVLSPAGSKSSRRSCSSSSGSGSWSGSGSCCSAP